MSEHDAHSTELVTVDGTAPPALFQHCEALYKAMWSHSNQPLDGPCIYTGRLTHLCEEIGLSPAHYTLVTRKMIAMGCMVQLQRGGGGQPSKWQLKQQPTRALFDGSGDGAPVAQSGPLAQAQQRIRDLDRRLRMLEDIARRQGWPV